MDSAIEQQTGNLPAEPASTAARYRILVRSSNWLGDAVMTVPAIRAIKQASPDAHLAVLTRDKLADFWKIVPEVDQVIPMAAGDSIFAIARKIKSSFDTAILLPNSIRSALEVFLARIPRRVGYRGKSRSWLLSEIFTTDAKPGRPRHQMHHYLDLAEFAGARIDPKARQIANAFSLAPNAGAKGKNVKIGLCPGAEYGPAKRWLPERFAEAMNAVSKRRECEWMLFGAAGDRAAGDEIVSKLDGTFFDLIGRTTLAELIDTLSDCHLLLTNDTGTMHLAAFLGVPTVSIFGSTEPLLTGPLGTGHRVLRHHVECAPCFLRECPIDFRCMKAIEVDEVVEAVLRMLDA